MRQPSLFTKAATTPLASSCPQRCPTQLRIRPTIFSKTLGRTHRRRSQRLRACRA